MPLIGNNPVTTQLKPSSNNLKVILNLKESVERKDVTTAVVLACLDEIKNSRLGWSYPVRKLFATVFIYSSATAFPVVILSELLWYCVDLIKAFSTVYDAQNFALLGSGLAALLLADYTVGKIFGVRPLTAVLIMAFNTQCQGALLLSKQVSASYTNHEKKVEAKIEENWQKIKQQLSGVYSGIADELIKRHQEGTLKSEMDTLQTNIPIIRKAFSEMGLSNVEIAEILAPLTDTVTLLTSKKASE